MTERLEHRLKRMQMRSWRRGTKEMDMILGPFADRHLAKMSAVDLDLLDQLLEENDQDLYLWVSGDDTAPAQYAGLLTQIASDCGAR